jgi:hypothetical protein
VPNPSRPKDKQADAAPVDGEAGAKAKALASSLEGRSFGTRN